MNSGPLDNGTIVYYESKISYMKEYFKARKNISTISNSTEAKKKTGKDNKKERQSKNKWLWEIFQNLLSWAFHDYFNHVRNGKETNRYWTPTVYQIEPVIRYEYFPILSKEKTKAYWAKLNGKFQQKHIEMSPNLFYIRCSLEALIPVRITELWRDLFPSGLSVLIPLLQLGTLKMKSPHPQRTKVRWQTPEGSHLSLEMPTRPQKRGTWCYSPSSIALPKLAQAPSCTISPLDPLEECQHSPKSQRCQHIPPAQGCQGNVSGSKGRSQTEELSGPQPAFKMEQKNQWSIFFQSRFSIPLEWAEMKLEEKT